LLTGLLRNPAVDFLGADLEKIYPLLNNDAQATPSISKLG
jgi:hypothetical protein